MACWAALFGLFAAVAGGLGHIAASEWASTIARDLVIVAAILVAAALAMQDPRRRS